LVPRHDCFPHTYTVNATAAAAAIHLPLFLVLLDFLNTTLSCCSAFNRVGGSSPFSLSAAASPAAAADAWHNLQGTAGFKSMFVAHTLTPPTLLLPPPLLLLLFIYHCSWNS
jgi:hypothetical protein